MRFTLIPKKFLFYFGDTFSVNFLYQVVSKPPILATVHLLSSAQNPLAFHAALNRYSQQGQTSFELSRPLSDRPPRNDGSAAMPGHNWRRL